MMWILSIYLYMYIDRHRCIYEYLRMYVHIHICIHLKVAYICMYMIGNMQVIKPNLEGSNEMRRLLGKEKVRYTFI
jgi:hypothetical protein